MNKLFMPTARQINWLLIAGFLALGYALYIRYLWIEQSAFGLACDGGLPTWSCSTRKIVAALFDRQVFGIVALALAALNFLRPTLIISARPLSLPASASFSTMSDCPRWPWGCWSSASPGARLN